MTALDRPAWRGGGAWRAAATAAALLLAGTAAAHVPATGAALADSATTRSDTDIVPTLWWAQGSDGSGQFGAGGVGDRSLPFRVLLPSGSSVPDGVGVTSISVGTTSACAVHDGEVSCWGANDRGQLGDATTTDHQVPGTVVDDAAPGGSQLPAGAVVTDVSVADGFACAVADGRVYCWGDNTSGQLGDDSWVPSTVPVEVATVGTAGSTLPAGTVTDVETGGSGAGAYACAIAATQLHCWGSRLHGRLGSGVSGVVPMPVPGAVVPVWGAPAITDVSLGQDAACAVANGRAWCWGWNATGQLGDGANFPLVAQTVPKAVETSPASALPSSAAVTEVAVGASSACALHDGSVYCWGTNVAGQLGAGIADDTEVGTTAVRRATAVATLGAGGSDLPTATAVSGLDAGRGPGPASTFCVLGGPPGGRSAYCWGDDHAGQIGIGATTDQLVPRALVRQPVSQLPSAAVATAVAVGDATTILVVAP